MYLSVDYGLTQLGYSISPSKGILIELLITLFLVTIFIHTTMEKSEFRPVAPLVIGLSLTAAVIARYVRDGEKERGMEVERKGGREGGGERHHYTAVLYCTTILQYYTAVLYCSTILQYYTAALYCSTILQYYTAVLYCSTILQYYTAV